MPDPLESLKAKPVMGIVAHDFFTIDYGRSISLQAESGVNVSFGPPFDNLPVVIISQHQEKETWIDPNSISTTGFTWYSTESEAGIDWIAVGT